MADLNQHEEAAKALAVGKKALDAGQLEKAAKMFEKSLRMRKTAEAETLLACAKKGLARQEAKNNPEPVTPSSTPSASDRPFTPEQEQACKVILQSKTHYETLSIEKTASADEIKKAYRKLALKFHPDKCAAPNADEAFKKISKAFKVLLDADDRAHYDRYGDSDNVARPAHGHRHGGPNFHEMDADDLFRFFATGGMGGMGGFGGPNIRVHHFGNRGFFPHGMQREQAHDTGFSLQPFISLFVMLLFLLSSWGGFDSSPARSSGYRTSNQIYSLFPDKVHTIRRKTSMHGVVSEIPYFVDSKFASTIGRSPRDLYYVEKEVETSLHQNLKEKCYSETTFKNEQINRARASRDADSLEKAMKMETPSCTLKADLEKKQKKV